MKICVLSTILAKNSRDTLSGSRKPLPPQQCWKILHFCELKDQKITDFQHCKWGEGEIVYSGPRLLSRIAILAKNSWDTSSGSRKPLPPQQCWKILHFCELKDQKITDFQHCKWGEGEIVYSGPRLLSRIAILAKNSWDTSSGSRKPLPPQQCWKILHFCELKDQTITDFQHCKWGKGEIVYSGPRLLSRIVGGYTAISINVVRSKLKVYETRLCAGLGIHWNFAYWPTRNDLYKFVF